MLTSGWANGLAANTVGTACSSATAVGYCLLRAERKLQTHHLSILLLSLLLSLSWRLLICCSSGGMCWGRVGWRGMYNVLAGKCWVNVAFAGNTCILAGKLRFSYNPVRVVAVLIRICVCVCLMGMSMSNPYTCTSICAP